MTDQQRGVQVRRPLSAVIAAVLVAVSLAGCSNLDVLTIKPGAPFSEEPATIALPPLPAPPAAPQIKTYSERVEALVLQNSADLGVELGAAEWHDLSQYICDDLAKGGSGIWTTPSTTSLPDEDQRRLADLNLDGAILSTCPSTEASAEWKQRYSSSPLAVQLVSSAISELYLSRAEYSKRVLRYNEELAQYSQKHGVDTSAYLIPLGGSSSESGSSGGATVVCRDGSISKSTGKQGACSHHGGVR